MFEGFEDVSPVSVDNRLCTLIQNATDELDAYIDEIVYVHSNELSRERSLKHEKSFNDSTDSNIDILTSLENPPCHLKWAIVEVNCLSDNVHYAGKMIDFNEDRRCLILYNEDGRVMLNMNNEIWHYQKPSINASVLEIFKTPDLNEKGLLQAMIEQLEQKPFHWHHFAGIRLEYNFLLAQSQREKIY